MSIYDSLILPNSINLDYFPFDCSYKIGSEKYRFWQTKDLNPSLDVYSVLRGEKINDNYKNHNKNYYLCRRSPPITKWTIENEGLLSDEKTYNLISTANHWRSIRYTGNVKISEMVKDGRLYEYNLVFNSGILEDITFESSTCYIDNVFPEPNYDLYLDFSDKIPLIKNTTKNILDLKKEMYDNHNYNLVKNTWGLFDEKIAICLLYYNLNYKEKNK